MAKKKTARKRPCRAFECPRCHGTSSYVRNTRSKGESVGRYRVCIKCGTVMPTEEVKASQARPNEKTEEKSENS